MDPIGIAVFAVTYALISMRRLDWLGFDRPAGALLGACAMVALGVLSPHAALAAVDGATLLLLFGVMGLGAFLGLDGFLAGAEERLARWARTPRRLLGGLVWSAGILSAFITNDAVCVLGAPLVVGLVRRHGLPPLPYLFALATAANTGSVATLVGNPQNMLCAQLGGLVYREYALSALPIAVLGLALNHLWLDLCFRRTLREHALRPVEHAPPIARRAQLDLLVIALTAVAYTLGADLAWAAASGFVALMLAHRRDTQRLWIHIDFSILLFFAGLFVVVQGLVTSGLPAWLFERFPLSALEDGAGGAWSLTAVFLLGSNLVSNVPFILVVRDAMSALEDPERAWKLLAVASTFAGNLTLLGSVANVIVAESARELGGFGFRQHLKIGLPLALATTALGALWLLVVEPALGLA